MFRRMSARRWRAWRPMLVMTATAALLAATADCGTSAPTMSPTPAATATASPAGPPITIRWYLGLGSMPIRSDVEAFVKRYNQSQHEIVLELLPPDSSIPEFQKMLDEGDPPDIVGPCWVSMLSRFPGAWLDLHDEIVKQGYDLARFDPKVVELLRLGSWGQVGLPYTDNPLFIFYNKDLFSEAGLPDLPRSVGETYMGKPWDWNTLRDVATQLTFDQKGRTPADPKFDPAHVRQWGFDFFRDYDGEGIASAFGGGSLVASDGKTAQIPQPWRDGWRWYRDAIWTQHIAPSAAQKQSLAQDPLVSIATGRIAMSATTASSISTYSWASGLPYTSPPPATPAFKRWDIGVLPSWNGSVTSPADLTAFALTAGSRHQDEAFRIMVAIMADPGLRQVFDPGGQDMPAELSAQAAYFAALDTQIQNKFPGNTVTWSVLVEMAARPAIPHQQSPVPNALQASNDVYAFLQDLISKPGLNIDDLIDALRAKLQADFDASPA
jgi:ABC-type glycerol-3-phosphate transport system substrate-binding protein